MRLPTLSMTTQILIALIAGIICGIFFGELCSVLKPVGDIFIKLMQVTVLPSITIALITVMGDKRKEHVGILASKSGQVLLLIWAVGVAAFFSMQFAFPKLVNASFFSTSDVSNIGQTDLLDLFIPQNPFRSLAEGAFPAIVFFCILLGYSMIGDSRNKPIMEALAGISDALSRMNKILTRIMPIGIFALVANTIGTITPEKLIQIQVFLITLVLLIILLTFLVLPLMVSCFTQLKYRDVISAAGQSVMLGFSTGNVFITLPLIIDGVHTLFKDSPGREEIKSYSEVLVPIAYSFPSLGTFIPFLFILFISWFYQKPLTLSQQIVLVMTGIPSFFGNLNASVQFLLNVMELPSDSLELYISSDSIHFYFIVALVCMSMFAFTAITAAQLTGTSRLSITRTVLSLVIVIVVFALTIGGLRIGFGYMLTDTYRGDEIVSGMGLPELPDGTHLDEVVNARIYTDQRDVSRKIEPFKNGTLLDTITRRDLLRVGYIPQNVPFNYFNSSGALVGFNIQMAYDLAIFLGVSNIEFVPISYDTIEKALDKGICDIAMPGIAITPDRLQNMKFTSSYMTLHPGFVVPDDHQEEFKEISGIEKMKNLRIAVVKDALYQNIAARVFPHAKMVEIDTWQDFFTGPRADVLLTTAEEGSTMTLLHPEYHVVIPEPDNIFTISYAYPISKKSDDSSLMVINYWLWAEEKDGDLNEKYEYWILGKNAERKTPRWSAIRDVFHLIN